MTKMIKLFSGDHPIIQVDSQHLSTDQIKTLESALITAINRMIDCHREFDKLAKADEEYPAGAMNREHCAWVARDFAERRKAIAELHEHLFG